MNMISQKTGNYSKAILSFCKAGPILYQLYANFEFYAVSDFCTSYTDLILQPLLFQPFRHFSLQIRLHCHVRFRFYNSDLCQ